MCFRPLPGLLPVRTHVSHLLSNCYLLSSAIFMTKARRGLVAFAVTRLVFLGRGIYRKLETLLGVSVIYLPARPTLDFYFFISCHLLLGKDLTWQLRT